MFPIAVVMFIKSNINKSKLNAWFNMGAKQALIFLF